MSGKSQIRLAVMGALAALIAVLIPAGLASGNAELDAVEFLDCGNEAATTEDADAATALAADGYSCTRLFNKPTIDSSDPQQVGQMWFTLDGTILRMRVLFFGGANTGFVDSKICLDDDKDPINDVAPGGATAPTCVGNEFQWSVNQGGDGGPIYSGPVKSAMEREESAGKLEVAVGQLSEISESFGGVTLGGWNVNLGPDSDDLFSEVLPHFNLADFSIVGYVQPLGKQIDCGETVLIEDAAFDLILGEVTLHTVFDGEVWLTGADCPPKPYTDDVTEDTLSFLPFLEDTVGRYTIVITLDEQVITTDPETGQITSLIMEYSESGDFGLDSRALLACESEPPNDDPDDPAYQAADWTVNLGLLPEGESACYYDVSVTTTGTDSEGTTLGTEIWRIFFEDDPGFSFK